MGLCPGREALLLLWCKWSQASRGFSLSPYLSSVQISIAPWQEKITQTRAGYDETRRQINLRIVSDHRGEMNRQWTAKWQKEGLSWLTHSKQETPKNNSSCSQAAGRAFRTCKITVFEALQAVFNTIPSATLHCSQMGKAKLFKHSHPSFRVGTAQQWHRGEQSQPGW